MRFSKNTVVVLLIIGIISFGSQIYFVDFSIPVQNDNFTYTLRAFAHSQGDFSQSPKKMSGWPIFLSPFFVLIQSDDFLDYSNATQLISMTISTLTIIPMYCLGRKFFDKKYALVAASLLGIEPHLNYNGSFGFAEPLYIILIIISFHFILNNNRKFTYLAFVFAGFAWWVRIEGIIIFFAISAIYLITYRKSIKLYANYLVCIGLFVLIVSPIFILRSEQYEDPFYFFYNERAFVNNISDDGLQEDSTPLKYIEKNGLTEFIYRFIIIGIYNISSIEPRILFPFLIFFLPFGIIFSFRAFDQNKILIKSNWIFIIVTLAFLVIPLSIIPDRRFLFYLYPFLIIFSVIPIQRVIEYGLSTFSWSENKKNGFLIGGIIFLILVSSLFILRFDKIDHLEEYEKIEFAKFLVNDIHGNIVGSSGSSHMKFIKVNEPLGNIKNYTINTTKEPYSGFPYTTGNRLFNLNGESIKDLFSYGQENDIKFLVINEENPNFEFLNNIFLNDNDYPFLTKIFDSKDVGYIKLKLKVFEINYKNFVP